jgi:hypothetical protein
MARYLAVHPAIKDVELFRAKVKTGSKPLEKKDVKKEDKQLI